MSRAPSQPSSFDSLAEASRDRATFSGHGASLGAAGPRQASYDPENSEHLRTPGQSIAINPGSEGFEYINIGVAWNRARINDTSLVGRLLKLTKTVPVDIDIGCLYELADGTRGAIQAFGGKYGSFTSAPYIALSGDERSGVTKGIDEILCVNGAYWDHIRRMIIYLYIYNGPPNWSSICPRVMIDVPGQDDLYVVPGVRNDSLKLCAIGGLENSRGGIKLTNYTEFFPGHDEMDRAFGFGLSWGDGRK